MDGKGQADIAKASSPQADSAQSTTKPKRSGKTREHYNKQKSQAFSYFRIDAKDSEKILANQFTIYNFITSSFAFSQTKKELTIQVLEELKKGETTFIQMQKKLGAKKSTLYMLVLSLQKSGLIEPSEKNAPLRLSGSFSKMLSLYSQWWEKWLKE
ncbi:MAG: hypothetical protein AABX01_07400 [Candidatus Micrarchaeota archaeon]